MVELNFDEISQEADFEPRVHPTNQPTRARVVNRKDFFKRDLLPGDFVVWLGGGYFTSYYNYGLVLMVNHERRFARIRNHNRNKITIWNTHNIIILARFPDYSMVPPEFLGRVGIDDPDRVSLENL